MSIFGVSSLIVVLALSSCVESAHRKRRLYLRARMIRRMGVSCWPARRTVFSENPVKNASAELAAFAANLHYDNIPSAVIERAKDLLVDWLGSVLAGKGARPVQAIERYAAMMGPSDGAAEVLISR